MAKFAQYYLEYINVDIFSKEEWAERQKHFGSYFESNNSIEFFSGEGNDKKTYKHEVYHLSSNKDIIVMRIANNKQKDVIQNFKKLSVKHEPPCYVIIDNRDKCRRIAIQSNKDSFYKTDTLKDIIQDVLEKKMMAEHNINIRLHPQFYPRDFYKAWELRQYTTSAIRFNVSEGELPRDFSREVLDDNSIMGFAIKVNEEECRKKYRTVLELNPPEDKPFLEVDYESAFIRNLVNLHAMTGASIVIITKDGSRFSCYIDDDEESNMIVTNEIDSEYLDDLFPESGDYNNEDVRKKIEDAEKKLVEFVNNMKVVADEENGKENVA